jgi:hypothetical protein
LGILLALFVGVPLLDTIALVLVGRYLGFWPTVAIVLLSGVIGAQLTRRQGLSVWRSLQADLAAGRVPAQGLMECVRLTRALAFQSRTGGIGYSSSPYRIRRISRENALSSGRMPSARISSWIFSGVASGSGTNPIRSLNASMSRSSSSLSSKRIGRSVLGWVAIDLSSCSGLPAA